ncbi:TPA: phage tail tip lysozyme [Enterococcus faecium]
MLRIIKKRTRLLSLILLLSILFGSLSFSSEKVEANFEGYKQNCLTETKKDGDIPTGDGTDGNWSKEGTKGYINAQKLWNYWKGKGFNGSAISGVLGNVDHEGGFTIPDRAEGHYGDDSATNGVSANVVPSVGAGYPIGKTGKPEGGAGHYQFTPYSKFKDLGDKDWLDSTKQSDFVWNTEVSKASWLMAYIDVKTPEAGAEMWSEKYERPASYNPAKSESARKAYEVFGGANISSDSALANAQGTANEGEKSKSAKRNNNVCGSKDSNKASTDIIETARGLLGYFTYMQVHGETYIGSIKNPDKNGKTDCSGFVWLVLAKAGYKHPENMAWFTGTMESDAKKENAWLKEIDAKDAKAGDIVIVNTGDGSGSNGHTAILTEDWQSGHSHPENPTSIIQMGGIGDGGVNENPFNTSFSGLMTGSYTITFARAIKE